MKTDIFFRAFELRDAEFINSLRRIEQSENLIGGNKRFVSLEREKKWVEDLILNDYRDRFYVAICEKKSKDEQIIGYASITNIDYLNRNCFWNGLKIHPDYTGKGYGSQASLLLMKFVFEELNMERCMAHCIEDNHISKKMMEKAGFKLEALQRHSLFKNGKYHNMYVLSMLKDEYFEIKKKFDL